MRKAFALPRVRARPWGRSRLIGVLFLGVLMMSPAANATSPGESPNAPASLIRNPDGGMELVCHGGNQLLYC